MSNFQQALEAMKQGHTVASLSSPEMKYRISTEGYLESWSALDREWVRESVIPWDRIVYAWRLYEAVTVAEAIEALRKGMMCVHYGDDGYATRLRAEVGSSTDLLVFNKNRWVQFTVCSPSFFLSGTWEILKPAVPGGST